MSSPPQPPPLSKTLSFRCHCSSITASFSIPHSYFPLTITNCHCHTSRSVSGTMCTSNIVTSTLPPSIIPNPPIPLSTPYLTPYSCSPDVTRYFCSQCGASVLSIASDGMRKISTGLLEGKIDRDMFVWDGHMWLCDTYDGGLADKWVLHSGKGGGDMKRWWTWANEGEEVGFPFRRGGQLPESTTISASLGEGKEEGVDSGQEGEGEKLRAKCRCGGVDFYISRPPTTSTPEEFWIKDKKWLTQCCVCPSCRHATGYAVSTWTFISKTPSVLSLPDGTHVPSTLLFGTLKKYDSSKGVERYFCGTCGAKVFYRQWNFPCNFMDVATGLLAREGEDSRKEGWLWWGKALSFPEKGEDEGLVEALTKGLEA